MGRALARSYLPIQSPPQKSDGYRGPGFRFFAVTLYPTRASA